MEIAWLCIVCVMYFDKADGMRPLLAKNARSTWDIFRDGGVIYCLAVRRDACINFHFLLVI